MKKEPRYAVGSVGHALELAVLLQREGGLRLSEVADRLGVARSTAHRLLAMLVYHEFAEQDAERRYVPGPVLQACPVGEPASRLRQIAPQHIEALSARCKESVNVQLLVGDHVRFIASVEPEDQVLRVGNREGRMLPAHLASGGRAILSRWTDDKVAELYSTADAPQVDLERLMIGLRRTRLRGYAINDQATETGVSAIGRAIRQPVGAPIAAMCIAMPTVRFSRERADELGGMLAGAVEHVERALAQLVD
jgi:IclR family transcriptional regulator, acetate operon repressor